MSSPQGSPDTRPWFQRGYRRSTVDMHIPDWDPAFLSRFDTAEYVDIVARAGFQQLMPYTNSCVGLALWKTKVGQMHANLHGRDMFGEIVAESRRRGLHTAAYFIVTRDNWAAENHPTWRLMPPTGNTHILDNRYGQLRSVLAESGSRLVGLSEILAVRQKLGPHFNLMVVAVEGAAPALKDFLASHPLPAGTMVALDGGGELARALGEDRLPTTFFLDERTTIRHINRGHGSGYRARATRWLSGMLATRQ